ncbi:MAG: hypothetical protein OWQ54_02145 [Sulfolobaceae archaeon]|nr:hypothetical protein [Sulfolobaceae archaeon]
MLYISSDKKVRIDELIERNGILIVKGEVASSSRKGLFHNTSVIYSFKRKYVIEGSCDCEISRYYGICKHQIRLLYVAFRARKKINKENKNSKIINNSS